MKLILSSLVAYAYCVQFDEDAINLKAVSIVRLMTQKDTHAERTKMTPKTRCEG